MQLDGEQLKAIDNMFNGCILVGDVGSGKSRTAIGYYLLKVCKGGVVINGQGGYSEMENPKDLYIITTAKKRDDREWHRECSNFLITENPDISHSGVKVTVDSWNNIKKYRKTVGAFFIFDEQRVIGSGAWVKAFLDISRKNQWVLLSATPGDTWKDYIPVFIANGFYRNKTDFLDQHVIWSPWSKFPKIEDYKNKGLLIFYRNHLLVKMKCVKHTTQCKETKVVAYDKALYSSVWKDRWDPYDDCPIEETGKLFYLLRKVVNSDETRLLAIKSILSNTKKVIIFYNFDYELEILKSFLKSIKIPYSEWNGHKHEPILEGKKWAYLVNYAAGSEGWNCTTTDTIIFYSLNYSYRIMTQAAGRIDRRDTPYKYLFYYYIRSMSPIDIAINRALEQKKKFNENDFINGAV